MSTKIIAKYLVTAAVCLSLFILVLLGKYQFFINAINTRDLVSLALGGIGVVVGLVSFAVLLFIS